jgi:hypothetical protein
MNAVQLDQFVRDDSLRRINFFNGRLLSAEDLTTEQSANRAQARHLGVAIGAGVSYGLEVARIEPAPSSKIKDLQVEVKAGLAVNRHGEALYLRCDQLVTLALGPGQGDKAGCVFSDCEVLAATGDISADGFYILTIAPASAREDLAPVSGLGNASAACNSRYFTEGVRFRLVPLTIPSTLGPALDDAHARNIVAYHCFGITDAKLSWVLDHPFEASLDSYGLLDNADPAQLTCADVPLALIKFTKSGIDFLDMWSVRRRLVQREVSQQWRLLQSDDRIARAEAAFLQFEEQISSLLKTGNDLSTFVADDQFSFLPGGGLLPIAAKQFSKAAFFKNFTIETRAGDTAFLRQLIHDSLYADPIAFAAKPGLVVYDFDPDFLFFTRDEELTPAAPAPVAAPPAKDDAKGMILVSVTGPKGEQLTIKTIEDVSAVNVDNKDRYPAMEMESGLSTKQQVEKFRKKIKKPKEAEDLETWIAGIFDAGKLLTFLIEDLPKGRYIVTVSALGYNKGTATVDLGSGEKQRALIELTRKAKVKNEPPGQRRPKDIEMSDKFRDRYGRKYDKVKIIPDIRRDRPPWDKGNIDPAPPDVLNIERELQEILNNLPDVAMTPTFAGIVMNPDYTFDSASDDPYAYVATTDGAYLPLLMAPADLALPAAAPVSAGGVPEFSSPEAAARMDEAGLGSLDFAGTAYASLVADTLGRSISDAKGLVNDARNGIETARAGFAYYSGLSPQGAAKLQRGGFNSDVALANASAADLQKIDGALFPAGFAERLIGQARAIVPERAWSLEKSELGLKQNQIAGLNAAGIQTLGALATATNSQALRDGLGMSGAGVTELIGAAGSRVAEGKALTTRETPLLSLDRVDKGVAATLTQNGISSVRDLSNAKTKDVATALSITEAEASKIIESATVSILMDHSDLSERTVRDLVKGSAAPTLGAVLDVALKEPAHGAAGRVDAETRDRLGALSRIGMVNR